MTDYLKKESRILKIEGILLLMLGLIAMLLPQLFTLGIELLIGILLLSGGVFSLVRGVRMRHAPGSGITLAMGGLFILVGFVLLAFPLSGMITLTLLLGMLFVVQGIAEIIVALQHRQWASWGWLLISGVVSLIIGLLLVAGLPGTASWAIGLLVGINLIFSGSWLLLLGFAVDKQFSRVADS
ncbi:HdeD family acid-resistance protein [Arsukibacterium sp.]|uniref:HdeD family acid-resistance protein n=1 Tax=Arsukibacterium sp. TaxID=1977258 RepID=UPI00299F443F|nr:DUF308 domain-containing protein [Arsukibacterium sp.]MDX1677744.1 DUF308 domain-containing protein [Arsukibacterium sp.]